MKKGLGLGLGLERRTSLWLVKQGLRLGFYEKEMKKEKKKEKKKKISLPLNPTPLAPLVAWLYLSEGQPPLTGP